MLEAAQAPSGRRQRLRPASSSARAQRLADRRLVGYAEYGDPEGFPVLALHGTPGSRLMFRLGDGDAYERGLRLIAPDRPGYGLSSPHPGAGLSAWARDAAALADGLGLGRFAVLGVSGGAPYAAACAALMADRVAALALVSPIGPVNGAAGGLALAFGHEVVFRRLGALPWARGLVFHTMRTALGRTPGLCYRGLVARATAADRAILTRPEVRASLLESFAEGFRGGISGASEDLRLFGTPWDFDPATIAAPARAWHGTGDAIVPDAAARLLVASIPGCETAQIDGAGHYWVFDGFRQVADWLAAMRPGEGA